MAPRPKTLGKWVGARVLRSTEKYCPESLNSIGEIYIFIPDLFAFYRQNLVSFIYLLSTEYPLTPSNL